MDWWERKRKGEQKSTRMNNFVDFTYIYIKLILYLIKLV